MNSEEESSCDHVFDGGYCLECWESQLCALCEEETWQTRCDICNGDMICINCYTTCDNCDQNYCIVCAECNCEDSSF